MVKRFSMAALWVALPLVVGPAAAGGAPGLVTGPVTWVRDGDTIELGALAIRLNGLAAPEGRAWRRGSLRAMCALVLSKENTCELGGDRTHDRCVGIRTLEGDDIVAEMMHLGLARDCPRYSGGRYQEAELQAAAAEATIGETYALPTYVAGESNGRFRA